MAKSIKEILETNPQLGLSPKEILAQYDHIELTEEELTEAMIAAKRKKEARLKEEQQRTRIADWTTFLTRKDWGVAEMGAIMRARAPHVLGKSFILDEAINHTYSVICAYFANHPVFEEIAKSDACPRPSLEKGLWLAGNFGVGKTALMLLFSRNPKQCYFVYSAKDIANVYEVAKKDNAEDPLNQFIYPYKNAVNDYQMWLQPQVGLCIDDMGTEDVKNNFGNKRNVIADIIEGRYNNHAMGKMLHITSNLSVAEMNQYYGGRVVSRLSETMNLIVVPGEDRRKSL